MHDQTGTKTTFREATMTAAETTPATTGKSTQAHPRIPLSIHLACVMLLVAVTVCYGPLGTFFL
ncbi:MAG: hypothetical protein WC342_03225 [Methanoregula sp.]